jgi:hypothetical protein
MTQITLSGKKVQTQQSRGWNKQINPLTTYQTGNLIGVQGAGNEQLVAARALKHGFLVFFKLWSDTKYDMVLESENILFRVQVKASSTASFPFKARQRGGVQQPKKKPPRFYTRKDCDLLVGVDSTTGDCYIFPIDYVTHYGKDSISRKDAHPFLERWDYIKGNNYITVTQCRDGPSAADVRNNLSRILPQTMLPTNTDALYKLFYEVCPP